VKIFNPFSPSETMNHPGHRNRPQSVVSWALEPETELGWMNPPLPLPVGLSHVSRRLVHVDHPPQKGQPADDA